MRQKGSRGRFILTLKRVNVQTIKQGLYEREFWTYDFESEEGELFHYGGRRYALFINKTYEIVATFDSFRYGANQLKRIKVQPVGPANADLFERA